MTMSKIDHQNDEYLLLKKVAHSDSFHFIVVQYNHYDIVRQIKHDLSSGFPTLSVSVKNPDQGALVKEITECKHGIVFVERFENLFLQENHIFAMGLNQRRDKISQNPIKVILFLPQGFKYLQDFKEKLPDIASITSMYFDFRLDRKAVRKNINISYSDLDTSFADLTEALRERDRLKMRIVDLEGDQKNEDYLIDLKIDLASAEKFLGNFRVAKEILENLLANIKVSKHNENKISIIENNLAVVLKDLGDYNQAKTYLTKILKSDEKKFGADHPSTATSYSNLAMILNDLGEYEQAKICITKALKSDEKNFGVDHPITAKSYSNLAVVFLNLDASEQAKIYLTKALKSDEKNFGVDHPNTAIRYSNLSTVFHELGEYDLAKVYMTKALKSDEKNFGVNHPNTALSYSNLANILQDLGEYDQAKILLEKAKAILQKTLGDDHPNTKKVFNNLKSISQKLQKD